MHRITVGLVAVLFVSAVFIPAAGAKTTDATCFFAGSLKMTPPLSPTAQPVDFKVSATADDRGGVACPATGGGPATMRGTLHSPSAYCGGGGVLGDDSAVGRLTLAWPDATTSTLHVIVSSGQSLEPGLLILTGRVASGVFVGDRVAAHMGITTLRKSCLVGGIRRMTFATGNVDHQRDLAFVHA